MFIEFRLRNYRSFREAQTLSMVAAAPFKEHARANTFDPKVKGFDALLHSAVVYGPNAAGKTNLLRAIQFMQSMVLNSASTTTGAQYIYSPFKFSTATRTEPTEFQVTFVQNGTRYEYGFEMGPRRIEKEWLIQHVHTRGRTMFERNFDSKREQYKWSFSPFLKGQRSVWSESTRPDALFLSTAIQLNSQQLAPVFEWFQRRLVVIVGATSMNPTLTLQVLDRPDGKERLLPFFREADLGIADLDIKREPVASGALILAPGANLGAIIEQAPGVAIPNLVRITFSHWSDDPEQPVGLDFTEESSGTQILFRTAGAWLNVWANGEVLLFDEIDTSLHPLLTRFLIDKFHSVSTNPNNAQLIFSTHDTSLLSQDIFRRDQIWFVDKERDGATRLYPLTDFKPRNDEKLESWYMRGRYGALPLLPNVES